MPSVTVLHDWPGGPSLTGRTVGTRSSGPAWAALTPRPAALDWPLSERHRRAAAPAGHFALRHAEGTACA